MALELMSESGKKGVSLTIKMPLAKNKVTESLASCLREMYRKGECADVSLCCAGKTFLAHKVVLSCKSPVFKEGLCLPAGSPQPSVDGRAEIRLADVVNPEAVKYMLDYIYDVDLDESGEEYNPRTQEINRDVLVLAQNFALPGLTNRAVQWLTKDISTNNVVEIISICETFRLEILRDRIIEQLTMNKKALAEVASHPQIVMHPKLMVALLQHSAKVCPEAPPSPPLKKARKM